MAEVWVARDEDDFLCLYLFPPTKNNGDWEVDQHVGRWMPLDRDGPDRFPEIKPGECRKARIVLEGEE